MKRQTRYSEAEWAAHTAGADLALEKRQINVPKRLTILEQTAFHEGYYSTQSDFRDRKVVDDVRAMLGGASFIKVLRRLVSQHL